MKINYIYNYNCMYSCFIILNMPINVFGNSLNNFDNKIDTSLFVKKPYLKTNYIEANIEEDIDLKNQYKIKNLPDPSNIKDACNKNYVDNTINELSLVRNNKDNDFGNYKITNINSITLYKQAENDNEVVTKAYVDQFHQENERSRRELGINFYNETNILVKNDQDNNLNNNKLTNLDSITINRNPVLDNEVSNKKYIDDSIGEGTLLRFNQTLSNYLKVSVGDTIYNLTKYDKIKIIDTTEVKYPNEGKYLLQKWNIIYSDINGNGKLNNILKSTKTHSPTSHTGAVVLPPIGNSFMYIETSIGGHGNNVFVSFERTDIIQISNISFYYNRYSAHNPSMGRFRIQLLSKDSTWTTQYTIEKNTQYSATPTEWTLLNRDFTTENYGMKLVYDEIDTPHADMCFSNITITHSVF